MTRVLFNTARAVRPVKLASHQRQRLNVTVQHRISAGPSGGKGELAAWFKDSEGNLLGIGRTS